MLPAVPTKVFEQNPQFQALYHSLSSSKLNPDGSTKISVMANVEQDTVIELDAARTELAKKRLVIDGLTRVSQRAENLPVELLQAVELVAAHLDGRLAETNPELLEGDFEYFREHVDIIASAMSKDFCDIMDQLRYMATSTGELQRKYPGSPPKSVCSSGTADRKGLAKSIRQRQQSLSQARQDLLNTRERIMLLACEVLNAHTTCLGLGVRTLEQTIHGSVARGTRAQAEYLSTVAEGVSGKSRIAAQQARASLYTPKLQQALQDYTSHLESSIVHLKRREAAAKDDLAAYEEAGEGMREIGRRFAELKTEIEKVQAEMQRLDNRS